MSETNKLAATVRTEFGKGAARRARRDGLVPVIDRIQPLLAWCEAAASDPDCLAVWAETRDRFLGRAPAPTAPPQNQGQ
mgnify:CR=1 FL=1